MPDTVNFCLTLDPGPAGIISAYARRLALGLSTDYVLGPEALPHVSILKLNDPPAAAADIWTRLEPSLPRRLSLRLHGLTVYTGKNKDVWLMLNVVRTAELVLLQEMVARQMGEKHYRGEIGDLWWPHITLLHSIDGRLPADWALDRALLNIEELLATPVLGLDRSPGLLIEVLKKPNL